jgi:hypothetical protein
MQGKIAMQKMHVFAGRKILHLQIYASAKGENHDSTNMHKSICILMVMEYGVLQHVRQPRFGSEGMLEDYAVSVLLQRG